jgi:hypothetical protein
MGLQDPRRDVMFQTLVIEWTREYLITVAVTYIFPVLSGFIRGKLPKKT